ncbi:MAG: hypothetical protein ACE5FG_03895 [Myxococcota bacterium]
MGLFVDIEVSTALKQDRDSVQKLSEVCPVGIFAPRPDGTLEIVARNVDECTLCELCLEVGPPGAVRVVKIYDEGRVLERSA